MCILSKDIIPSDTVVILNKTDPLESSEDGEARNERTLIYSTTLTATKDVGGKKRGIMLLPLYVFKDSHQNFADVSENDEINYLISKEGERLPFKRYFEDEMDCGLMYEKENIEKFSVGRFNLSLFTATKANVEKIERKYGDVHNPHFSMLGDKNFFPVHNDDGKWIYILADFDVSDVSARYNLKIDYSIPSDAPDYVPTIHEKADEKQNYDIVTITNLKRVNRDSLENSLSTFIKQPNELKRMTYGNDYDFFGDYVYYGYCDKNICYRDNPKFPKYMQTSFESTIWGGETVNGKDVKEMLVWDKKNNKFYFCAKEVNNRMLCLGVNE